MDRRLVTIRKVLEIKPIPDADLIELAVIDGWQCIVKKGTFQPGDLGVYFEVDSYLPVEPRYEFLRKSSFRKHQTTGFEGFRIKTCRMRGQLSQGLLMPLSEFDLKDKQVGDDVTEELKVEKWEAPIPAALMGTVVGLFPSFISKSDQERIQNLPNYFSNYKETQFEVTIKLDGSSGTYFYKVDENRFGVCSRNMELKDDDKNTFWKIAREYEIAHILRSYNKSIALQGEVIGEGIQKNPEQIKGHAFHIFDIFDIEQRRYYDYEERKKIFDELNSLAKNRKLDHVPVLLTDFMIFQHCDTMEKILEFANGPSMNAKRIREGIVCKSKKRFDSMGNPFTISFKVINNAYLLKYEE